MTSRTHGDLNSYNVLNMSSIQILASVGIAQAGERMDFGSNS